MGWPYRLYLISGTACITSIYRTLPRISRLLYIVHYTLSGMSFVSDSSRGHDNVPDMIYDRSQPV